MFNVRKFTDFYMNFYETVDSLPSIKSIVLGWIMYSTVCHIIVFLWLNIVDKCHHEHQNVKFFMNGDIVLLKHTVLEISTLIMRTI